MISERLGFQSRYRLWVDVLCINQCDDQERSSHVAKMRDIFAGSWTVITSLGTADDDSDSALALLKTLADFYVRRKSPELNSSLLADKEYLGSGKWLSLHEFLLRPHWSRLWIIREIAFAPSNVLMLCGPQSITWQQVKDGLSSSYVYHWYSTSRTS
jgi:hypothetical protein